jgi:hypothetical protein
MLEGHSCNPHGERGEKGQFGPGRWDHLSAIAAGWHRECGQDIVVFRVRCPLLSQIGGALLPICAFPNDAIAPQVHPLPHRIMLLRFTCDRTAVSKTCTNDCLRSHRWTSFPLSIASTISLGEDWVLPCIFPCFVDTSHLSLSVLAVLFLVGGVDLNHACRAHRSVGRPVSRLSRARVRPVVSALEDEAGCFGCFGQS